MIIQFRHVPKTLDLHCPEHQRNTIQPADMFSFFLKNKMPSRVQRRSQLSNQPFFETPYIASSCDNTIRACRPGHHRDTTPPQGYSSSFLLFHFLQICPFYFILCSSWSISISSKLTEHAVRDSMMTNNMEGRVVCFLRTWCFMHLCVVCWRCDELFHL